MGTRVRADIEHSESPQETIGDLALYCALLHFELGSPYEGILGVSGFVAQTVFWAYFPFPRKTLCPGRHLCYVPCEGYARGDKRRLYGLVPCDLPVKFFDHERPWPGSLTQLIPVSARIRR